MYMHLCNSGVTQVLGLNFPLILVPLNRLLIYMYAASGSTQSPSKTVGSCISLGLCHHSTYITKAQRMCPIVLTSRRDVGMCVAILPKVCNSIQPACNRTSALASPSVFDLSLMSLMSMSGSSPHFARSKTPCALRVRRWGSGMKASFPYPSLDGSRLKDRGISNCFFRTELGG